MTRPKNRSERRKRNALARELSDRKYHQRVVEPYKRKKRKWDDEAISGAEYGDSTDGFDYPFAFDEYD